MPEVARVAGIEPEKVRTRTRPQSVTTRGRPAFRPANRTAADLVALDSRAGAWFSWRLTESESLRVSRRVVSFDRPEDRPSRWCPVGGTVGSSRLFLPLVAVGG